MIYLEIPLVNRTIPMQGNADAYDTIKNDIGAHPDIEYVDGTKTLKFKKPWIALGDMKDLQKLLYQALTSSQPVVPSNKREAMIEAFGTPAYRDAANNQTAIDQARETVRPRADNPLDAPDTSGINFDGPPADTTKAIMNAHRGVCLARPHSDPESLATLKKNVEDGDIELLFLEEFSTHLQQDLDDYLAGDDDELPDTIKTRVEELKASFGMDWEPVLKAARAKGAKIYPIDNEEARDCSSLSGLFEEHRDTQMNAVVFNVMDAALRDPNNQGKKFMAVVGAAHANTHPGGIPGVGQMFGIPVVRVSNGRANLEPEKKELRGMPSRDEQVYIDLAVAEGLPSLPLGAGLQGTIELKKKATAEAARKRQDGTLPSFEEQVFVDQYVKLAKKNNPNNYSDAELRAAGQRAARAAATGGTLVRGADVAALMPNGATLTRQIDDEHKFAELVGALDPDPDNSRRPLTDLEKQHFQTLMSNAPDLSHMTDRNGRNLLHLTARKMDEGLVKGVTDRFTALGVNYDALLDAADSKGDTPLHLATAERLGIAGNDGKHGRQTAVVNRLVGEGADPNRQNGAGLTPLHLAARNNNSAAVGSLLDANADASLTDARGWTPMQFAQAVGSPDAELTFYNKNVAQPTGPGDAQAPQSTLDLLMRSVLAEDPADLPKIRAAFEKLYDTPALRPIIELAALSAAGDRAPPAGGSRFVIAKGRTIQSLYVVPGGGKAPGAAYDHSANVVMIPGDPQEGDMAGVLMHEMTHMSAHIVNGHHDPVVPYTDDVAGQQVKAKYIEAIESDVAGMHLLSGDDPLQARVRERIMARMKATGYDTAPYDDKTNEEALLEEFLVGVPQLIAEFGEDAVKKYVPKLHGFFTEHATRCTQKAQSPQFANARAKIDDTAIRNRPPHDYGAQAAEPRWVEKDANGVKLDKIMGDVRTLYTMHNGAASGVDGRGNRIALKYDTSVVKLSPAQEKDLAKKLDKVKKALAKSLDAKLFTTGVSEDGLRALVDDVRSLVENNPADALEKLVQQATDAWLMKEKRAYLGAKAAKGPLTDQELAEACVLSTEFRAKGDRDYDVNTAKHAELVADLTKQLAKLPPDKKDSPFKQVGIIKTLAANIDRDGDKSQGAYQKTGKKADPHHVSLDTKNLKRQWLRELKAL